MRALCLEDKQGRMTGTNTSISQHALKVSGLAHVSHKIITDQPPSSEAQNQLSVLHLLLFFFFIIVAMHTFVALCLAY